MIEPLVLSLLFELCPVTSRIEQLHTSQHIFRDEGVLHTEHRFPLLESHLAGHLSVALRGPSAVIPNAFIRQTNPYSSKVAAKRDSRAVAAMHDGHKARLEVSKWDRRTLR